MLIAYTARIDYVGLDKLDISRKGQDPLGIHFAPSWRILGPMVERRRRLGHQPEEAWVQYCVDYREEMEASQLSWPSAWEQLRNLGTVTLCCYCSDPEHCHRRLLVAILKEAGDTEDRGERNSLSENQLTLF